MIVASNIPAVLFSFALHCLPCYTNWKGFNTCTLGNKAITTILNMELPRLSSFHSLQNSGQTQNSPCPETVWHTGPLQTARSFWLTQSGLCTPKVIEMVWITESTNTESAHRMMTFAILEFTMLCWNWLAGVSFINLKNCFKAHFPHKKQNYQEYLGKK